MAEEDEQRERDTSSDGDGDGGGDGGGETGEGADEAAPEGSDGDADSAERSDGSASKDAAAEESDQEGGSAPPSPGTADDKQPDLLSYTPSYAFLVIVTVVNLVADLWSKAWAKNHFESVRPGDPRRFVVIEEHMNLIFAKNRGGAWGLLQNETESLRRPFFLVVSVAAIVFIVSLYRKLQPGQNALKWGLPLVLGGALGNLVDRIRYGYVVDFIDVYMQMDGQPKHWPTFNVADISICVGVGLMAIDMFTSREAAQKKPVPRPEGEAPTSETKPAKPPGESEPKAEGTAGEGA